VRITGTGHNGIPLESGEQFTMTIPAHPLFVSFTDLSNLILNIYNRANEGMADFSSQMRVFHAVYRRYRS
jgi:hypothetical protein